MRGARIAIVITNLEGGGAERVAINLANSFVKRGYLVDMVLLSVRGSGVNALLPEVRLIDLHAKRMRGLLIPLIRYLRVNRPSVLLANIWPITSIALIACKVAMLNTRLIAIEHTTWSRSELCESRFTRWQVSKWMHYTFPFIDRIVAVSEDAANDLADFANLDRNMITVIHNPVVDSFKLKYRKPLPQIAGWSEAKFRLLSVGKLKSVKDFATLLHSFKKVLSHLDVSLLILGEGECRSELELLAKKLGIQDKVYMPGFVDDPTLFYMQATLFVLTSKVEGFANVIVEALAEGVPVVSTDCLSGPREILANGKFGTLVPVGDINAITEAILDSLKTIHNRAVLIKRAKCFTIDKAVDKYLDIL